jgi:hypothetical protein
VYVVPVLLGDPPYLIAIEPFRRFSLYPGHAAADFGAPGAKKYGSTRPDGLEEGPKPKGGKARRV